MELHNLYVTWMGNACKILVRKSQGRDNLGDLGTDGRTILK
jgi:hypothetical protein